jgi:hypothetical protein
MLIAFIPGLFHLMAPTDIMYLMLGIAFIGIGFWVASVFNLNYREDLLREERREERFEKYLEIRKAVEDGKTEEALNLMTQFYNYYFK